MDAAPLLPLLVILILSIIHHSGSDQTLLDIDKNGKYVLRLSLCRNLYQSVLKGDTCSQVVHKYNSLSITLSISRLASRQQVKTRVN